MKILQINAVSGTRSTGRTTVELAQRLEEAGHSCCIAYAYGDANYKNSYKIGTTAGHRMHAFLARLTGLQACFSRHATKRFLRFIQSYAPDVVHVRNIHSHFLDMHMLFAFLAKQDIPTVLTLHDCFFYTGKCMHYTMTGCYKWRTQCDACPRLKQDIPSWFFDFTKKMHQEKKKSILAVPRLAVVGVSQWIANEARRSFLNDVQLVEYVYNWVDLEIFKPQTSNLKTVLGMENKFVVLSAATFWMPSKGIEDFNRLADMLPEDIALVLLGRQCKGVAYSEKITFIPETQNLSQLAEIYCGADVFINLSMEESFGKVTAEALACGTPVVVYNSTASPELVGEGCGYVAEGQNLAQVLAAIQTVQANGKQYYTKSCRAFAVENFDKDKNADKQIAIYKQITGD